MKRLMFGIAVGLTLIAVTAQAIGSKDGNNIDIAKSFSEGQNWVNSQWQDTKYYYLSEDVNAWIDFQTAWDSSSVVDFQNHTLRSTNNQLNINFSIKNEYPEGHNYLTLKNGTLDGSEMPDVANFSIYGLEAYGLTLDNMVVTGFKNARLCKDNASGSTLTFKNGSVVDFSGCSVYFLKEAYYGSDNTISFESGSKLTVDSAVRFDGSKFSGDENRNGTIRFTGEGTTGTVAGSCTMAETMSGFNFELLDGASFSNTDHIYFGRNQAKWGRFVVDNATLKSTGRLIIGYSTGSSGHQVVFKNGAKIQLDLGIAVGNNSDNNTLIVSNADVTGLARLGLGACAGSNNYGCRYNNKAYFYGQGTTFGGWPLGSGHADSGGSGFYGANNLLCFDNCTLSDPTRDYEFNVYNPNPSEEGGDEWVNNEIRLVNGAKVNLLSFLIGDYNESSDKPVRYQKLTIGNDSTLTLEGSFIVSHVGNEVVLSNGTLRVGASNPGYAEFDVGFKKSDATQAVDQNVLEFHGDHPQVSVSGTDCIIALMNGTLVRFYLPEDGVYKTIPINTPKVWIKGHADETETSAEHKAPSLLFPNIDEIRQTFAGSKQVTLIHCDTVLNVASDVLEAANAALPEGCSVRITNKPGTWTPGDLILTIKGAQAQKPGAVLLIK